MQIVYAEKLHILIYVKFPHRQLMFPYLCALSDEQEWFEFKEKRFLRIGSSKCNMKDYPKREIEFFKILDGRTETIETVPAKYQDLTFQKLFGYYGSKWRKRL